MVLGILSNVQFDIQVFLISIILEFKKLVHSKFFKSDTKRNVPNLDNNFNKFFIIHAPTKNLIYTH